MGQGLTVVLGDFDRVRAEACQAELEDRGLTVTRCETGAEVLEHCGESPPDIAVLEVFLPRKNGFEVLKALKEDARTATVKVMLLLDEDDDYGEHRARLCGADVIHRRPIAPGAIADLVRGCVQESSLHATTADGEAEDGGLQGMLEAMEGRVQSENPLIAHITDKLTGLYNEPYMELKIAEEFKKARRFSIPLSCVAVGFDDDGALSQGDAQELRGILNDVSGLLLCESRDIDHIARQNVVEFFLLLPHTDSEGATAMAARILKSIEGRGFSSGDGGTLTASAGISTFTGADAESSEELTTRCWQALLAARRWGGNRVTAWSAEAENANRP